MSIAFQSLVVRSPRRVRLAFSGPLGLGAYDASWFAFTCTNSLGSDAAVQAVLLIASDSTSLELALALDLAPGGVYDLAIAAGLPGADATTADAAVSTFTVASPPQAPSESVSVDELSGRIFRVDVQHDGSSMVETAAGDLATSTGPLNVKQAIVRRLLSEGLPHNQTYGARARDSNDAPAVSLSKLSGRLQAEARLDPRVVSATISAAPDDNDGTFVLNGQLELIGGALVQLQKDRL